MLEENYLHSLFENIENDYLNLFNFINSLSENEIYELRLSPKKLTLIDQIILSCPYSIFEKSISILKHKFRINKINTYLNIQDIDGNTPLLFAAYRGNLKIIQNLINNGSLVDCVSKNGLNLIHMASQGNNPNIIIFFKEKYKFDINKKDNNGNTPLHWACYSNADNSINFLLSFVNDVNVKNNIGQTPLHICVLTENIRNIRKIMKKGGDVFEEDNLGRNCLKLAMECTGSKSLVTKELIENKPIKMCFYNSSRKDYSFLKRSLINEITFGGGMFLNSIIFYFLQLNFLSYGYNNNVINTNIGNYNYNFDIYKIIFIIINIIFFLCFILLSTSDPGYIKKNIGIDWISLVIKNYNINRICPYCKVNKIFLSKHCFICNHCVQEQNHHCNMIGNCIGKENMKFYLFFLFCCFVYFLFEYFISFKIFLIYEITKFNEKMFIPFIFIYRRNFKDIIAIIFMNVGIFGMIMSMFLFIKQIRKNLINKKIKKN
jgi:palmitoyltransferase